MQPKGVSHSLNIRELQVNSSTKAMAKKNLQIKLEYDVCGKCGVLFDDQGENGWWIEKGVWWHECNDEQPARIVVRKLARVA
jgi:hypothetical protein